MDKAYIINPVYADAEPGTQTQRGENMILMVSLRDSKGAAEQASY